jgi:hypothetical protein
MPGLPRPQGTPRTRKTIKIVEVNWRPSWEPEEGLRENEDVARMVDTWNEDNKFNPPARMTTRERQTPHKHAATGHTPQTPAMGAHLAHPPRRHQIQHVGNPPGLDVSAGCLLRRGTKRRPLGATTSRRRRCTSRPTDGDDARSLRIQQRRQLRGVISEERLAKLHKMYGHGTGADTMEEQGPKHHGFTEALIDSLQRQRTQAEGGRTRPASRTPEHRRSAGRTPGCTKERYSSP